MVNAQNLKFPIPSIGPLPQLDLPGPLDRQGLDLPDFASFAKPQPPKGQSFLPGVADEMQALEDEAKRVEGQYYGARKTADDLNEQRMGLKRPDVVSKRVPRDTQLLTGGIGLLLRALGASHEATMGGVGTALSGMQQRLDEEAEKQNTKAFNEYQDSMNNLNLSYEHVVKMAGIDSDRAKTLRGQIDKFKAQIDADFNRKTAFYKDIGKTISDMDADRKLTPTALNTLWEMASSMDIENALGGKEAYWDLYDRAVRYESEMDTKGRADTEKAVNDATASFEAAKAAPYKTKIEITKSLSAELDYKLQTESYESDLARIKDEAESARLKRILLDEEIKFLPEKQRIEKQRAADAHANALSYRSNVASEIGRRNKLNSKDAVEIDKGLEKDFDDLSVENAEKNRKLAFAKQRRDELDKKSESTSGIQGTIDDLESEIATNDETLNRWFNLISDQGLRDRLEPYMVRAGTRKRSESRFRGPQMQGG
jgi:hypothetical protein